MIFFPYLPSPVFLPPSLKSKCKIVWKYDLLCLASYLHSLRLAVRCQVRSKHIYRNPITSNDATARFQTTCVLKSMSITSTEVKYRSKLSAVKADNQREYWADSFWITSVTFTWPWCNSLHSCNLVPKKCSRAVPCRYYAGVPWELKFHHTATLVEVIGRFEWFKNQINP